MKVFTSIVLLTLAGFLGGCSGSQTEETVQPKEGDINIDPNAPALPPETKAAPPPATDTPAGDQAVAAASEGQTATPPPQTGSTFKEADVPTSAPAAPAATPKVDELVDKDKSPGYQESFDTEKGYKPAKPLDESPAANTGIDDETSGSAATSGKEVGSGKQTRYIKADRLNIREKPNRFSKVVGELQHGDQVHVTIRGAWAKLEDGQWIRSRWLIKKTPHRGAGSGAKKKKKSAGKKKKSKKA